LRLNHLFYNRISQIVFAIEVMKECAFGCAGFIHDAVDTSALETVPVKFVESSFEYFSPRAFWLSVHG
jgi:hypothetical protein